ncbi:MAG: ATP-binding protein, partial [Planctomycetota bacterium]|nr:ATP-binding protein [Planctomycetota bacterium]
WESDLQYRNLQTGDLTDVHAMTFTIKDPDTKKPHLLANVSMDITERKHAQREREELIAKLEAQNAELERFTYTVSHDLKSPLITIGGFLGMLKQNAAAGNIRALEEDITFISNAVQKMERLLKELLDLSRIGRQVNPPEDIALADLAQEVVSMTSEKLGERGIRVEISPGLPVVFGDRLRLWEVLQNVVDNAAKFMGDQPRPRIEIGSRRDGEETVCYVRDNGMGIDPAYHEKIFGLFDRLNPKSEGTGVGLAVVKRIVEIHGGRIWVESEGPGQGSTFCFTIP